MKIKQLIITACLLAISNYCLGQPNDGSTIVFDGSSTVNYTYYTASNRINLLGNNGEFSLLPGNTLRNLSIEPNSVFYIQNLYNPADPESRTLDYSLPVGTTKGFVDVSPTGAASYNIPIFCSPGTAGMQPQISIVYNSQSGMGLLGHGWDISGLSSITRVPTNNFYDNNTEAVKLGTTSDKFSLDGNRLDLISGTYGAAGSIYATEYDNFSKITAYGQSGNGPQYFEVKTKDGLTMLYGDTDSHNSCQYGTISQYTTTVLAWQLYKVTDQNGNSMEYFYTTMDEGESVISEIKYTINSNASITYPYNSVKFMYSKRSADPNIYYNAGNPIADRYVLNGIKIIHLDTLVKEYNFNYADISNATHLYEIVEYGKDRSHYNSTLIKWGDENTTPFESTQSVFDTYPTTYALYKTLVCNLNNDGFSDAVLISRTSSSSLYAYYLCLGSENGFEYINGGSRGAYFINAFAVDKDGDGKDEIFFETTNVPIDPQNPYQKVFFTCLTYNKTTTQLDIVESFDYDTNIPFFIQAADFYGDGINQILVTNEAGVIEDIRRTGGSAIPIGLIPQAPVLGYFKGAYAFDFNGNGKSDFLIHQGSNISIYEYNTVNNTLDPIQRPDGTSFVNYTLAGAETILPGDFNGDGKTDLLVNQVASDDWYICYSTGKDFDQLPGNYTFHLPHSSGLPNASAAWYDNNYYVADYDGDGKSDILCIYQNGTPYWSGNINISVSIVSPTKYYKDGSSFKTFFETQTTTINGIDAYFLNANSLSIGDANADGKADLIWENSNSNQMSMFYKKDEQSSLVHNIVNGMNSNIQFDYYSLPKYQLYTEQEVTSGLGNEFNNPIYIVGSLFAPNGIGGMSRQNYTYAGGVVNTKGLGFLGFNTFISQNAQTSIQTILYYTNSKIETVVGKPHFSRVNDKIEIQRSVPHSSTLLSATLFKYNFIERNINNTFFVYPDTVTETDYLSGIINRTKNVVNIDGNTTSEINKAYTTDNSTPVVESTTTNTYTTIAAWHIPSLLDYSTQTITRNGQPPFDKSIDFSCNTLGNLIQEVSFAGTPKALTTTYSAFTPCGQPTVISTSGSDILTSSITYQYDNLYRFLTKETDALNNSRSYSYEGCFGLLIKESAIDNLLTKYNYDGYGTLKSIETPDGNVSTTTLSWAQTGSPANAVSFTTVSIPGHGTKNSWYDILGRQICTKKSGFSDYIYSETAYDEKGLITSISDPQYGATSPTAYTTFTYDNYQRLISQSYHGLSPTEYNYNLRTTTVTSPDGKATNQTIDASGVVISASDNGGAISYQHNSMGLPISATTNGSSVINTYDIYGNRLTTTDPNAGQTIYTYNCLGQLLTQTDANGNTFTYSYDLIGRNYTVTDQNNLSTTYTYITTGNGKGQLFSETLSNNTSKTYSYDNLGRNTSISENILGNVFITSFFYDQYNRLTELTYPSSFGVQYVYDIDGNLEQMLRTDLDVVICQQTGRNALDQPASLTLGTLGLSRTYSYDAYNNLSQIQTSFGSTPKQDYRCSINPLNGNVNSRTDYLRGLNETFTYDNLDRLTSTTVTGQSTINMDYASNGNIQSKTGTGTFVYDPTKVHAVKQVLSNNGTINTGTQVVNYNTSNLVSSISEVVGSSTLSASFSYGPDDSRKIMTEFTDGNLTKTTKYLGLYEEIIDATSTLKYHYIPGPDGLLAVYILSGGKNPFYYVAKDHLGSITHLIAANGTIADEINYDAWGRRRNPADWTFNNVEVMKIIRRGFTGHEHLENFSIINMNGRLYDPILGRMLSPDPLIQAPNYTQNYNRYSYCWNNPLKYTDPSGFAINASYSYSEQRVMMDFKMKTMQYVVESNMAINAIKEQLSMVGGVPAKFENFRGYFQAIKEGESFLSIKYNPPTLIGMDIVTNVFPICIDKEGKLHEGKYQWSWTIYKEEPRDDAQLLFRITSFEENPITWDKSLDKFQMVLDGVGMIPGIGEPFDGANALISLARGNYLDASLSTAALIPFAGWASTTGKWVKNAAKTSTSLPTQVHHFATNKSNTFTPRMVEIADEFGLSLNGAWNKHALPHLGRHPNYYHNFVLKGMENARAGAGGNQAEFLNLFNQYVKQPVIQNPGLLRKSGW